MANDKDQGVQHISESVDKVLDRLLDKNLDEMLERKLAQREQAAHRRSIAEQEAIKAEIEKGIPQRSQEFVDRTFTDGKDRWRVVLNDKNGHPELVIPANSQEEAVARYNIACGIVGFSDPENQQKYAISKEPAKEPAKAAKKAAAAAA